MERQIIVVNQTTNNRKNFEGNFSTLADVKRALNEAGFNYSDESEFREISSRTVLIDDDSQLPNTVMRNGQETKNLVIVISQKNKKIASGSMSWKEVINMSRKEVYKFMKNNPEVANRVKEGQGKNYTNLPNKILFKYIYESYASNEVEFSLEERMTALEHRVAVLEGHLKDIQDTEYTSTDYTSKEFKSVSNEDSFIDNDELNDLLDNI